jgi:rare lipoprotein A
MRPLTNPSTTRAFAALAALGLTYAVSVDEPLGAHAQGSPPAQQPQARLTPAHPLGYGQRAVVAGRVSTGQPATAVALQFRASASSEWSVLATGTSGTAGSYRLAAPLSQSGTLRVATGSGAAARAVGSSDTSAPAASAEMPVQVQAAVRVAHRDLDVLSGHRAGVTGVVAPAGAGREVDLQVRAGRARWTTVARARTGAGGRYALNYTANHTGSQIARVQFAGDGANVATARRVGRLNVYRKAEASWYGGGGSLACGGTLDSGTLGVANKTLPCGTMLTLRLHGRSVRVPVIDRGPYVAGREFDLTEATKARLGFGGTGEVWTTS